MSSPTNPTRVTTTWATPGSVTSATCCCHAWWTGGRSTPTSSTATGVTSASRTTTSTPTWSCSAPTQGVFSRDWPIRTQQPQREPGRVLEGATVSDALLSPGCVVAGKVVRSVIGPGAVVEAGAEVVESVIFADTTVRAGATVTRSIVDSGCELSEGARVGDESVALEDPDAIAIIGRECRVGSAVKPGSRLAPGTTA